MLRMALSMSMLATVMFMVGAHVPSGVPGSHVSDAYGDTIYNVNAPHQEETYPSVEEVLEVDAEAEMEVIPRHKTTDTQTIGTKTERLATFHSRTKPLSKSNNDHAERVIATRNDEALKRRADRMVDRMADRMRENEKHTSVPLRRSVAMPIHQDSMMASPAPSTADDRNNRCHSRQSRPSYDLDLGRRNTQPSPHERTQKRDASRQLVWPTTGGMYPLDMWFGPRRHPMWSNRNHNQRQNGLMFPFGFNFNPVVANCPASNGRQFNMGMSMASPFWHI